MELAKINQAIHDNSNVVSVSLKKQKRIAGELIFLSEIGLSKIRRRFTLSKNKHKY